MFSDALEREAQWLNTSGDGLPALSTSQGGPFEIVQARFPRVPATLKTALYVGRSPSSSYVVSRFGDVRSHPHTMLELRLYWPLTSGTGSAEGDQLAFDQAIDQVLLRVQGPMYDKSHGGRFLAVGEGPAGIVVHYDDPQQAMQSRVFRATIVYDADDPEITN